MAVKATKGALIVSDEIKELTAKMKAGASDIVVEARQTGEPSCSATMTRALRASAKVKGRRMAVATTAGVLSMKEKAQAVRDEFKGIVDEAKQLRKATRSERDEDELEISLPDVDPDSSDKKGSDAKTAE